MTKETIEIWELLKANGGIDIKNYDLVLANIMQYNLSLPLGNDLDRQLKDIKITPENFIVAFFKAIEPYSLMMTDVMHMFKNAGSQLKDSDDLILEYNFENERHDVKFDLPRFGKWIKIWKKIIAKYTVNQWNEDSFWKLADFFSQRNVYSKNHLLKKWLDDYYEKQVWPDFILEPPVSSVPELNNAVNKTWNLWTDIFRQSFLLSRDRREFHKNYVERESVSALEPGKKVWNRKLLVKLDIDNWLGILAEDLFSTIEELEYGNGKVDVKRAIKLAEDIEKLFNDLCRIPFKKNVMVKDLKNIFKLPVWKKRYELYSTWILSQIIDSLKDNPYRIHLSNKKLIFSFSGTHLTTFENFNPKLHIWSGLQSVVDNSSRKAKKVAMQPDYSLVTDPVSNPESTILVIDFKQYKKPSVKNIINILAEYAFTYPNSNIMSINYGRIDNAIIKKVPFGIRDRVFFIEDMNPLSSHSVSRFREVIRKTVETKFGYVGQTANIRPDTIKEVVLVWDSMPKDLDLYLFIRNDNGIWDNIFYSNRGCAGQFPWAVLSDDIKTGYGPEKICISKWDKRMYHFAVHNFSGEPLLRMSHAIVKVICDDNQFEFRCPQNANGEWWDVFIVDVPGNRIIERNRIIDKLEHDDRA